MKVTIKDIANYCGVSITTVSWVLNGKHDELSLQTIAKVQKAAKDLGYARNEVARSLVTNRSNTIAFLVPDITNLFYANIIKAANKLASKADFKILLCNTDNSFEEEIRQIQSLDNRLIDGIVLASRNSLKLLENFDNRRDVPIIIIDEEVHVKNPNIHCVTTDNKEAATEITSLLLENHHENIFILAGLRDSTNTQQRLLGVTETIEANQNASIHYTVHYADYNMDLAYQLMEQFDKNKYTAILAFNDLMAYGAVKYLIENNLIDKVSVASFDASATQELMSQITNYKLTSINQNEERIGVAAMKCIFDILNGTKNIKPSLLKIPSELNIGNSLFSLK